MNVCTTKTTVMTPMRCVPIRTGTLHVLVILATLGMVQSVPVWLYIYCPVLRKTGRFVQPRKIISLEGAVRGRLHSRVIWKLWTLIHLAVIMIPSNYQYTSPNNQYTFTSVNSLWICPRCNTDCRENFLAKPRNLYRLETRASSLCDLEWSCYLNQGFTS